MRFTAVQHLINNERGLAISTLYACWCTHPNPIGLSTDTHFVYQMTLIFFCCFPSSIIITFAAMLNVFVRYLLYLLLLLCLYPGVNKELINKNSL